VFLLLAALISADSTPSESSRVRSGEPRGRGRGYARGRGRGYVPRRPLTAITLDTVVFGEAVRNLTSWEDPDASKVVFAVGNAVFAACVFGLRRAAAALWLAFLIAFLMPLRDKLDALEVPLLADALQAVGSALASGVEMLRARLTPAGAV